MSLYRLNSAQNVDLEAYISEGWKTITHDVKNGYPLFPTLNLFRYVPNGHQHLLAGSLDLSGVIAAREAREPANSICYFN